MIKLVEVLEFIISMNIMTVLFTTNLGNHAHTTTDDRRLSLSPTHPA